MSMLSLKKALLWIFISTLFVSGSAAAGWYYYLTLIERRELDDQYDIIAIVQTTPDKEALRSVYLAELLGLSVDKPLNLYRFDSEEAKRKLLKSVIIKSATIKKIRPGTIYIDYVLRKPIAYLGNYKNTAIDYNGVLFPVSPFFTPKKLPEIWLDRNTNEALVDPIWGNCCKDTPTFQLALSILKLFESTCQGKGIHLKKVDLSHLDAPSFGQREIDLTIEEDREYEKNGHFSIQVSMRVLRLSVDNFEQAWANYLILREQLGERNASIIDLRIPRLAFIKED